MRCLVAGAVICALTNVAVAADIYEDAVPVSDAGATADDWSGFYLGVHAGYGWAELQSSDDDDPFDQADLGGPVLGGQVGINTQWDWAVLGAEVDASWSGIDLEDDEDWRIDWLASARLRAGVALDRILIYGTGGVAFAGTDSLSGDGAEAGWLAGGGAEYLLTDFATAGAEYLHSDFGGDDVDIDSDVIRARLNLKLGGIGLPW